jgi:LmbE family N-acetylglucosaminyl deacetylase/CelD/BcsL family acetyltransferase involved in cellulose biosynthesis
VQLEVISTSAGLADLRDEWEDLEERDPQAPYYVTHRFVSAWWQAHADQDELELHVARIANNGTLVGIAPLAVRTRSANGRTTRVLRFAGQGDYLAPILDPDASAGAICKLLQRHLESAEGWNRVNLGNIPATSRWAHHLLKSSQNPAFTLHVECPYVDLTRYDDLAAFSAENVSSQLRNYRNKFHREVEPAFRVWRSNEGDILSRIVDLHRREKEFLIQQKNRTERYSLFEDPARLAHIRALFTGTDDAVTFGYESREGELIGYITCFDYRRTMLSWNVAYHPDYEKHRIGRVLHHEALAHLFESREADRFDFGAGRYPWKFEWTGDFTLTYRLQLDLKPKPEGQPADSQQKSLQQPPAHQAAPQEPAATGSSPLRDAARRLGLGKARRLGRDAVARLRPPVIWYIPHPDDETIFMGGSINMNRDRRNILVVLTSGGASAALDLVNRKVKNPLDRSRFMEARLRELTAAAEALGVPARDIITLDLPDGGVEVDDVHRVVSDMARRFPRASHRTLSYLDPHRDHANAGEALRKAYESGVVKYCLFHLPIPYVDGDLGSAVHLDGRALAAKRAALGEYEVWRPRQGRYAIGAHSVKKLLKHQSETPTERVHGPDYQP